MPQIEIEIEKTSKKFGLLPFLCIFCQIFDTLVSFQLCYLQFCQLMSARVDWSEKLILTIGGTS